jgi:hypothetical protein
MEFGRIFRKIIGYSRSSNPLSPAKHAFAFPAKISFDPNVGIIVNKIGAQTGYLSSTALINFQTGQMHLMEGGTHDELAAAKGLKKNEEALQDNWYGFRLGCENSILKVTPRSGLFGKIPIEYSSIFEGWIRDLVSDKLKSGQIKKILFYQYKYLRGVSPQILRYLPRDHELAEISLADAELKKLLPPSASQ